jgi:hypothetical protein
VAPNLKLYVTTSSSVRRSTPSSSWQIGQRIRPSDTRPADPQLVALVPLGVVTVTSTVPAPAGAVAVIDDGPLTVKLVALLAPNFTAVAPDRAAIATLVPPAAGPLVGNTAATVGAGPAVPPKTPPATIPPDTEYASPTRASVAEKDITPLTPFGEIAVNVQLVLLARPTVTSVEPTPVIVPDGQLTPVITDLVLPPVGEKTNLTGFELAERGEESGSTMINRLAGPSPYPGSMSYSSTENGSDDVPPQEVELPS